jgi:hypothetical protein
MADQETADAPGPLLFLVLLCPTFSSDAPALYMNKLPGVFQRRVLTRSFDEEALSSFAKCKLSETAKTPPIRAAFLLMGRPYAQICLS